MIQSSSVLENWVHEQLHDLQLLNLELPAVVVRRN